MERSQLNECPFCQIVNHQKPAVLIKDDDGVIAILDLYPAVPGHALVLTKEHFEDIYTVPEKIAAQIMTTAASVAKAIRKELKPDGLSLIQANGKIAGQTISHFHLHIVPRYTGDGIIVEFGHGQSAADSEELNGLALIIKKGLK